MAEVAELADAQDSKSCPGNRVRVQFPPSAMHFQPKNQEIRNRLEISLEISLVI